MSYQDVLAMPVRGFWVLSAAISRIRAEEALEVVDLFLIANANTNLEYVTEFRQSLLKRLGEPAKGSGSSNPREVSLEDHKRGIAELKTLG